MVGPGGEIEPFGESALVRWREGEGVDFLEINDFSGPPYLDNVFDPYGTNADGSIIVGSSPSWGIGVPGSGYVWTEETGTLDIAQYLALVGIEVGDWTLGSVQSISDDGKVLTGFGLNPSGTPEGWVAIIPEPGTALLLGLGLAALARRPRA